MLLHYKVEKNLKHGRVEIQLLKGLLRVSDTVFGAKLLPDEIDVIVKAST